MPARTAVADGVGSFLIFFLSWYVEMRNETLTSKPYRIVIELAAGDLTRLYQQKLGLPYSLLVGLRVVTGSAKGLAHMHSMPTPVVHRDVKSGNIMVMEDGVTGKVGDCGESRRVVSLIVALSCEEG